MSCHCAGAGAVGPQWAFRFVPPRHFLLADGAVYSSLAVTVHHIAEAKETHCLAHIDIKKPIPAEHALNADSASAIARQFR